MRDGTAEPVSRDQIIRHAQGQGNITFPCPAHHEQDWQPSPVDPYSAICDDYTYIHTYIHMYKKMKKNNHGDVKNISRTPGVFNSGPPLDKEARVPRGGVLRRLLQ